MVCSCLSFGVVPSSLLSRRVATRDVRARLSGFTLVELLVVIAIIGLLVGITLPVLSRARMAGAASVSLSNMRQMGIAVGCYATESNQYLPKHEGWFNAPGVFSEIKNTDTSLTFPSDGKTARRTHWPDHLFRYVEIPSIYISPLLTEQERADFTTKFVSEQYINDPKAMYGGYGWNYQYLGSDRRAFTGAPAFYVRVDEIKAPTNTVAIADTAGSRKGIATNRPGEGNSAVYVVDPPLGSVTLGSQGARRTAPAAGNSYYTQPAGTGGDQPDGTAETYLYRAFPAERNNGAAHFSFLDGHAKAMKLAEIDDFNKDGVKDNGYWNGKGDPFVQ